MINEIRAPCLYSINNIIKIIKMHKQVNCEAMQPTRKPAFIKSQKEEGFPFTDHSSSAKKRQLEHQDYIKEVPLSTGSQSPLKDRLLSSREQDLASSFSFSEEDEEY